MKKIFAAVILGMVMFWGVGFAHAQEKKHVLYFYADWCPHCQKVNQYFLDNGIYDKYEVEKLNFDSPLNKVRLTKLFEEKGYGGQAGIPAILIDDQLLVGDAPIIDHFGGSSPSFFQKIWGDLSNLFVSNFQNSDQAYSSSNKITILALVAAALVDAINPCAFAVLVLLLATVLNAKGKKRALGAGLSFSFAIFISYFAMGLGLYSVISIFNLPRVVSLLIGMVAVLLGLANLKDALWYGKFFIMEVPRSWRPNMQKLIRGVTSSWGAFGVGILVSLFLLPCSSGPYVVIVGMLAQRVEMGKTLALLALYNLIFVLPMLLITLGMYFFNTKMGKLEKWRQENLKVLHAIAGSILLVLGLYLIFSRI